MSRYNLVILAFIFCYQTVNCIAWTNPIVMAGNVRATSFGSPSIYTNQQTKVSHVFYCGDNKGLYYFQIDPKGNPGKVINIHAGSKCISISLTGTDDGKNIFVAEGVQIGNIEDAYFIESLTAGLTWKEPVQVPRENKSDGKIRSTPTILLSSLGRLWIFYSLQKSPADREIASVTRPPASTLFQNEYIVGFNVSLPYYVKSAISTEKVKDYIHLLWISDSRQPYKLMMYSQSTNSGIGWSNPIIICLLYTSPSPRDLSTSRMPSSA
eukprot:TRINITY_DN5921_c0_g1_i1.p1 TRINITY_DN5921_c0_g1~~TRINITY_DN5921_c0_g1_i1.p1  ORF type:complete len:267 (+),score=54.97 TRINITY_DN5921_c0_g1_i1:213-1013(+)